MRSAERESRCRLQCRGPRLPMSHVGKKALSCMGSPSSYGRSRCITEALCSEDPTRWPLSNLEMGASASIIDPKNCAMHAACVLRAGWKSPPAVCSPVLRARERLPVEGSADQVRGLSRRLQSGWKRTRERTSCVAVGAHVIALGDVSYLKGDHDDTHPICIREGWLARRRGR